MANPQPHIQKPHLAGRILNILLPLLTGIAVACYITGICSYEVVIRASLNGIPVGYVQSGSTFTNAELALEADIAAEADVLYDPDCEISYTFAHVRNPEYLTEEDCYELLKAQADKDFTDAYMLYVDGRQAAACESGDALYSLIDEIESELLESGGDAFSTVRIQNSLRIEKQPCLTDMLHTVDEINEILNPLADHTAETAVMLDEQPISVRVSAFASAAPVMEDPNVDYGVSHTVNSPDVLGDDLILDYTFVNTETVTETIWYETQYIDDFDTFIGKSIQVQDGSNGLKDVTYELVYNADGDLLARTPIKESIITEAQDKIIMVGAKEIPDPVPTGTFIWPCETPKGISSPYGWRTAYGKTEFHLGIDLPDVKGSPIYASDGGEVIWAGYTPSYGYSIRIQHADDYITVYAHLSKMHVAVGDHVYQGQHIADMGNTGMSYGSHLHFEVRIGSKTYDPVKYLPARDFSQNQ